MQTVAESSQSALVLEALKATHRAHGSRAEAARQLNIPPSTLKSRLHQAARLMTSDAEFRALWDAEYAKLREADAAAEASAPAETGQTTHALAVGQRMAESTVSDQDALRAKIKRLESVMTTLRSQLVDQKILQEKILGVAQAPIAIPDWLPQNAGDSEAHPSGVPILFGSDWHWGEVVQPSEIGGVNEFNLDIAHARLHRLVENTVNLLTNHMVNPNYPGIVFALGGDLVSGNIHEELSETNEDPIGLIVIDLVAQLIAAINRLKEVFGRVFVPCVAGNHGRLHKKVRAKESNFNSWDWLVYNMVAARFQTDPAVTFLIPDGPDALFSVYGHRYLLTHGNQFRGGDGMIGPLGPVTRGDHKKRSRNAQIGQEYDTLLIGHFHQLLQMRRVIMNGSLIGYNEYAYANNFGFEPPQQALWLTHPQRGITFSMPVQLDEPVNSPSQGWVSWRPDNARALSKQA